MKAFIAAAAAILLAPLAVVAEERAAKIAGEVLAYGSACPTLEVDFAILERWAMLNEVDMIGVKGGYGRDYDAVRQGNTKAASSLRMRTVSETCDEALRLFGPKGTVIAGVMSQK
ncbi:hypothetical protein GV67_04005 [Pseudorhizobium pelagicum]|uniref:Uncharacterized protein n=2 Tax=Pseudorhizobium pelagicum TaxID=1509405 RepID=A0A922TAM7_9HYPH|nr:hypothetical protein GV67_04005 [Pseudorhizobium pelagicum]KEQ06409.1 hypothetical protein GV68_07000 [Pseudorhizobium pelagicum]